MQIQIAGQHVEVTPGLRQFIAAKFERLGDMHPSARKAAVVLSVEKYRHTAEIHLHVDGVELSAKKTTKDMYASLEQALEAIEQQADKRKDRLRTSGSLRRGKAKVERLRARGGAADAETAPPPKVARLRPSTPRSLTLEEAVEALEASGNGFVLFKEPGRSGTRLLVRRPDASYALTEV